LALLLAVFFAATFFAAFFAGRGAALRADGLRTLLTAARPAFFLAVALREPVLEARLPAAAFRAVPLLAAFLAVGCFRAPRFAAALPDFPEERAVFFGRDAELVRDDDFAGGRADFDAARFAFAGLDFGFAPFLLLAFFAFGLALPAIVTSCGVFRACDFGANQDRNWVARVRARSHASRERVGMRTATAEVRTYARVPHLAAPTAHCGSGRSRAKILALARPRHSSQRPSGTGVSPGAKSRAWW
jgi:hypothetical protein